MPDVDPNEPKLIVLPDGSAAFISDDESKANAVEIEKKMLAAQQTRTQLKVMSGSNVEKTPKPNCPHCQGRGYLGAGVDSWKRPIKAPCRCLKVRA